MGQQSQKPDQSLTCVCWQTKLLEEADISSRENEVCLKPVRKEGSFLTVKFSPQGKGFMMGRQGSPPRGDPCLQWSWLLWSSVATAPTALVLNWGVIFASWGISGHIWRHFWFSQLVGAAGI